MNLLIHTIKKLLELYMIIFESFINGYNQSDIKNERYDNIIQYVDCSRFYKLTRNDIIEIGSKNIGYHRDIPYDNFIMRKLGDLFLISNKLSEIHKLKINFYNIIRKWDHNNLHEFDVELYERMLNDHYNTLLKSHNKKILNIIYENLESFKYGYKYAKYQGSIYEKIINYMDYLNTEKCTKKGDY